MASILGEKGEKKFLLGNEAIARGLIEGGLGFAAAYPGTPSSEIMDTLLQAKVIGRLEYHAEISTNEKVAYESAFAACLAGVRSFTAAKHVGINVAADAVATSAYIGTNAGFVFVSADDPNCWSSQNEQDNRWYARLFNLIMLEPSTPQEAKDFARLGFEISEKTRLPVMIRTTTRVSHMRGIVEFGDIQKPKIVGSFDKNPSRYVVVPANARRNHKWLIERIEKATKLSDESPLNTITFIEGNDPPKGRFGIITSGAAYLHSMEAVEKLGISAKILKLGFSHPLPRNKIKDFLEDLDIVLVVEEIDPVMEKEIKSIAYDEDIHVKIHGKDVLPRVFELSVVTVMSAIRRIHDMGKIPAPEREQAPISIPRRPPILCPGCPHRASYYAVKMALRREKINPDDVIYPTDIGCYTLGINPPFRMGDLLLCMGSSVGTANGLSQATEQPVIAFIGDSTFYHAGIPALINAVYNKHSFILVVLDNTITAMTGFQANPASGFTGTGEKTRIIPIEEIGRAIGVDYVDVIDPVLDIKSSIEKLRRAIREYKGGKTVLIVSRSPCALLSLRTRGFTGKGGKYRINQDKCINCGICYREFNCPAIFYDEKKKKPYIRPDICTGCGVCMDICSVHAIEKIS